MESGHPHPPTAALRRAGQGAALAVLLLWGLAFASARDGVGAWAVLLWPAVILSLLAGPRTWLRASVHGGPAPAPPNAAREILRGCAVSVCCAAVGSVTATAAIVDAGARAGEITWSGWIGLALVAGCAAAAGRAGTLWARARTPWQPRLDRAPSGRPGGAPENAGRPDVLDDAATLLARLRPGSGSARALAWLVRGLDIWGWSPRRHRTGFVAGVAGLTALAVGVVLAGPAVR